MTIFKNNHRLILSIGLAFFMLIFVNKANASEFFAQSGSQAIYEGESFAVNWFLDTKGKNINSLEISLSFPDKTLELIEAAPGNSLLSVWVKSPYLKSPGKISLTGGAPGGVIGNNVPIFRTVFLAKKTGNAEFKISEQSRVLLNDGFGTPDEFVFSPVHFNILPKAARLVEVVSNSHPNQQLWYKNNTVAIHPKILGNGEYSYSFSSNVDIIPDNRPMPVPEEIVYKNLPDGTYYFKLNLKTAENIWQEAGVYRVQIDQTPPDVFEPSLGQDPGVFSGQKFLSFSTVDKASGIKGYEIKNGWFSKYKEAESPWQIQKPFFGNKIFVKAYDFAGNSRMVSVVYPGYLTLSRIIGIILIIFIFIVQYWYKKFYFRNKK